MDRWPRCRARWEGSPASPLSSRRGRREPTSGGRRTRSHRSVPHTPSRARPTVMGLGGDSRRLSLEVDTPQAKEVSK